MNGAVSMSVSSILHNDTKKEDVKKNLHERFISDRKQLKEWAEISPVNDHWTGNDSNNYYNNIGKSNPNNNNNNNNNNNENTIITRN